MTKVSHAEYVLSSRVAIRYEVRCTFVDTDSGAKVQCPLSVFLSANYNQAAVFVLLENSQFCSGHRLLRRPSQQDLL